MPANPRRYWGGGQNCASEVSKSGDTDHFDDFINSVTIFLGHVALLGLVRRGSRRARLYDTPESKRGMKIPAKETLVPRKV